MSKNPAELVREFHKAFALPIRDIPDVGTPEERVLRVRLMLEEVLEFAKAAGVRIAPSLRSDDCINDLGDLEVFDSPEEITPDLVQMAHELADIQYVVSGTAVQLGIPINECVEEIHSANMCKLGPDGKPIIDESGKVRKPEGWKPADVANILRWGRLFQSEQTAECETCPDRADFETLCCKGGVGATVTDPDGLLEEPKAPAGHFKHCHIYEGSWCTCGAARR